MDYRRHPRRPPGQEGLTRIAHHNAANRGNLLARNMLKLRSEYATVFIVQFQPVRIQYLTALHPRSGERCGLAGKVGYCPVLRGQPGQAPHSTPRIFCAQTRLAARSSLLNGGLGVVCGYLYGHSRRGEVVGETRIPLFVTQPPGDRAYASKFRVGLRGSLGRVMR